MQPSKEYIELCQRASAVKKEWKPEFDDKCTYKTYGNIQRLSKTSRLIIKPKGKFIKANYTFLPNIEWLRIETKKKMGSSGTIETMEHFASSSIKLHRLMGY